MDPQGLQEAAGYLSSTLMTCSLEGPIPAPWHLGMPVNHLMLLFSGLTDSKLEVKPISLTEAGIVHAIIWKVRTGKDPEILSSSNWTFEGTEARDRK